MARKHINSLDNPFSLYYNKFIEIKCKKLKWGNVYKTWIEESESIFINERRDKFYEQL